MDERRHVHQLDGRRGPHQALAVAARAADEHQHRSQPLAAGGQRAVRGAGERGAVVRSRGMELVLGPLHECPQRSAVRIEHGFERVRRVLFGLPVATAADLLHRAGVDRDDAPGKHQVVHVPQASVVHPLGEAGCRREPLDGLRQVRVGVAARP